MPGEGPSIQFKAKKLSKPKSCPDVFLESIGKYKFNSLPKGISPKEHWMVYLNEVS